MSPGTPEGRRGRLSALLGIAALLTVGCSSAVVPVEVATDSDDVFALELVEIQAQCLREHGAELWPDPVTNFQGLPIYPEGELQLAQMALPNDTLNQAWDACGPMMTEAADKFFVAHGDELQERLVVYADCLRRLGYEVPNPRATTTVADDPFDGALDELRASDDPDVLACRADIYRPWVSETM